MNKGWLRLSVIVASIQLACALIVLYLLIMPEQNLGTAIFGVLGVMVGQLIAPINLLTGAYYFIKYRQDETQFKIIVGVSLAVSGLLLLVRIPR